MRHWSMEDRATDMVSLSQAIKDDVMATMRCAMPGIIESFDADTQTATIRAAIRKRVNTGEGTKEIDEPLLLDVPVLFLGGGSYALTFPVAKGDECLVVFADSNMDAWFQSGGVQNQVYPRSHDLSDGFAIVGFRSKPNVLASIGTKPNFVGGLLINGKAVKGGTDQSASFDIQGASGVTISGFSARSNGVVVVMDGACTMALTNNTEANIGTVPEAYRPVVETAGSVFFETDGSEKGRCSVAEDGTISVLPRGLLSAGNYSFRFSVVYFIA